MEYPKEEYKITAFIPEIKGREIRIKLEPEETKVIKKVISRFGGSCAIKLTNAGKKQLGKNIDYMEEDYINRGY